MHILERAHVYTHIRTHKKCAQQPKQSSAHCSTDGKVLMVILQWYVPIWANLCLRDTFPKKFPHQLSPKKYGKQENSQHLLIVIRVLARHWQVSTPCDMLPSQLCLMQRDALQSVSKFKHTSVHSQSKHSQADKQLGKCPESHRTRHSSRQAKVFDVTASPTSATLKGLLILSWVILFLQPVFYTLKLPA